MATEEREIAEQAASAEEGNGVESPHTGERAGLPGAIQTTRVNGAVAAIPSGEEVLRLNQRRIDLIRKQNRGQLTAEEAAEFERLDAAVGAYVNQHHPLPTLHLREIEELARSLGGDRFPPSGS